MGSSIFRTLKAFGWRQWLVVGVFLLFAGFTAFHAVHVARGVIHWRARRDEPIRGWMTVGYVAHSYRVPPHVLYLALGLPHRPPDRRPLRNIARAQRRSLDELRAILQHAIVHARPPYPPPPPPPPDQGVDRERAP
jgi:hypothetical protein